MTGRTAKGPEPTVCVGYSTSLPEVQEASLALGWRNDGQLSLYYEDEPVTRMVMDATDILATEIEIVKADAMRPKENT